MLAEDVTADRDYPALRRSLRDGFAVKSTEVPGTLRVRGEVRAGEGSQEGLKAGEALEIMTGAPVPEGADAVVMVEHVERAGQQLKIDRSAEAGQFINERGAEARQGSLLVGEGIVIDASHIATLAMTGHTSVTVFGRPKVAILATGDEIVALDEVPAAHQVRNSNSYMLASLVRAAGGVPTILPVGRDTASALRPLLEEGLGSRRVDRERRRFGGKVRSGQANAAGPGNRVSLRAGESAAGAAHRVWSTQREAGLRTTGQSRLVADHVSIVREACD